MQDKKITREVVFACIKFSLKHGIPIIGFVIGWGVMSFLVMFALAVMADVDYLIHDKFTYDMITYGLLGSGLGILLYWIYRIVRVKRCPHCKEILND